MNKLCRICLEEGMLTSIFTKSYNLGLWEMIEYCSNVKINKNDGLPEQICSNCIYKLGISYHFKQSCESSDVRLRQYLGLSIPSKVNHVMVMTDPIVMPVMTQPRLVKNCKKCQPVPKKSSSSYKKKPESEKLKRGPKPKPKKDYICNECTKEFRCQAQLEMHVRTHTGDKPFVCEYCPRRFSQKHNLTIHLRVHTGEKPFQCDFCSKRFSAQGNLQAHVKIHTGQKDHVCSLCSKSFITSSELTRHIQKHRGVRSYKCDICPSAYIHQRDLKLHKIRKHQNSDTSEVQKKFNANKNIDIINIEESKNVTVPPKDHNYTSNKSAQEENLLMGNHTIFNPESNKMNEPYVCSNCGEIFHCTSALAQHYLVHHKV
ncbi:zinc finger protein OZF [Bicyclus anynana]|uniref:Zinc finger protein OZF n=1 Tax=Bicyclus anynana TaxID=110368 RepID=A0A6J1MU54_BICAN|nr:zinc finger protein OZF [Bicyclus anynana]